MYKIVYSLKIMDILITMISSFNYHQCLVYSLDLSAYNYIKIHKFHVFNQNLTIIYV